MNDYTLMKDHPELYKKMKKERFIRDQIDKNGMFFDEETNTYHLRGNAHIHLVTNNIGVLIKHE
jgi:hypothetical protein